MSVIGSNILAGASGQGGGYNLTKSLRFRSSASAYLNRTPASASNRRTYTWSAWVKRSELSSNQSLFAVNATGDYQEFRFTASNTLQLILDASALNYAVEVPTVVWRDVSAWYHIVLAVDTTQATSTNRVKIYVNGIQQTVSAVSGFSFPAQNFDTYVNATLPHAIGNFNYLNSAYFNGYMTEINLIDGQALTPSSFGQTSSTTGVWIPKKYSGTYGTNGFYLPFTDTTSTSTLGTDFSGNSNTWTVNNISLTAGSTYDSMNDVPTLTSATTANYCVINPLANSGIGTLSNGNLQLVTSTNSKTITGTLALPSTGQYYWEITATDYITDNGTFFGVVNQSFLTGAPSNGTWLGFNTYSATYNNGTSTDTNGLTGTNVTNDGDIWCIAVDVTNNKFWIGRSRAGSLTWADGTTPAVNGSGATTLSLPSGDLYPMAYRGGSDNETYNFNFGQQPFAHTPPTGFVALNTFNLPTPTIGATASSQADKYFDISLWAGDGTGARAITNSGSMQPDWVWLKNRTSGSYSHQTNDSVRGATNGALYTDLTNAVDANFGITSFNSNGFTLGNTASLISSSFASQNGSGSNYVGWQWRASNATAVTNTAGSITSTVSANTTAGFSIVTYTGNNTASTVGHGLGVAPAMIIVKLRSTTGAWGVYHSSLTPAQVMYLNLNAAVDGSGIWNSTAPTSSVFSVGAHPTSNPSGGTLVAYCFAQVAGYSAFGSYTGNGSSDGPFVFTGFRPKYLMIKSTSVESWELFDTSRSPYNQAVELLEADSSGAENTSSTSAIDILSNGFKQRNTRAATNGSGTTYIYMAFAESPFKFSNAR